ncbi:MAG: hypothetical protein ACNA7O_12050 [Rhodobacterales bacterium]
MKKILKWALIVSSVAVIGILLLGFVLGRKMENEAARTAGFTSIMEFKNHQAAGFETKVQIEEAGFTSLTEAIAFQTVGFRTREQFEQTGFDDLPEAASYRAAGYETKAQLVKTGFVSLAESMEYRAAGFKTKEQFLQSGFTTLSEAISYVALGFQTKQQFLLSEFLSLEQARELLKYGPTHDEAISVVNQVSLNDFIECDKGGTTYRSDCFGKTVLWYATVNRYSSDGVYLDAVVECNGGLEKSKAIWSKELNKKFSEDNEGRCIQILAEIREANWATPTVIVKKVIWTETEQDKKARVDVQEKLKQRNLVEAEREKRQAIENNKFKPEWLLENYRIDASAACKPKIEALAKYSFRWTDKWTELKFPQFRTSNAGEPYVLTIVGNAIEFQNGFGAYKKMSYYCKYNVKTGLAVPYAE